jgi:uncharacterized protein YegP (UPF0339 family)
MAGKFVLAKTASGGFHFNLKASNGQTIATSETYNTKAAALNGVESIRAHASEATLDDQTDWDPRRVVGSGVDARPGGPPQIVRP